jgi:hypothetical protein
MRSRRQRRAERELEDHRRKAQGLLAEAEYARQRGDLEEALRLSDEAGASTRARRRVPRGHLDRAP